MRPSNGRRSRISFLTLTTSSLQVTNEFHSYLHSDNPELTDTHRILYAITCL